MTARSSGAPGRQPKLLSALDGDPAPMNSTAYSTQRTRVLSPGELANISGGQALHLDGVRWEPLTLIPRTPPSRGALTALGAAGRGPATIVRIPKQARTAVVSSRIGRDDLGRLGGQHPVRRVYVWIEEQLRW